LKFLQSYANSARIEKTVNLTPDCLGKETNLLPIKRLSMRKLKLYVAASLDGKIARKNGEIDWLPSPDGADYGYQELIDSIDATLMGFKTYEVCNSFGEWPYPGMNNYVFSHDPNRQLNPEATLINEDPVAFVEKLKQTEGKDIWLIGGGEINKLMHDAGLIDEYILAFIPVILGEGIELFPDVKKQVNLKLTRQKAYENGLVMLYLEKVDPEENLEK
jgi:dihydrofolate reductase